METLLLLDTDINMTAARNFHEWQKEIRSGNPEAVSRFYTENAILIPAIQGKIRKGRPEILAFYKQFLEHVPSFTNLINHTETVFEHENRVLMYRHFGTFRISFPENSMDGRSSQPPFVTIITFLWKLDSKDGSWRILHHQSSPLTPS
ncbi:MAG TPA: nuclear transport factor 2 family protein [Candidatus Fimivivens sp.]|nr:nuclear transport factor 2 family protein [Candidatus Fimivivens sp.]